MQFNLLQEFFNKEAHKGLGEWFKQATKAVKESEKLYFQFVLLSGVRAIEGIISFNLIADLGSKYSQGYNNEKTQFLEHFRYPNLFFRSSKNLYVSAVPQVLLDDISKACPISYIAIDKKLNRANLPMRAKQLRSFYATTMREKGLLSEQIDLMQGRVGKSIFLHHYFKADADPLTLSNKILELLPTIKASIVNR